MSATEMERLRGELRGLIAGRRVVLMGVGNRLRGDDAFGVVLAERIEDEAPVPVFVCHDLPEDYAVKAADLRPEVVIVLDAADFGGHPGEVRLIEAQDIPPTPGVTHRPSLEMMARFLELDAGAETWVLSAQPAMKCVDLGTPLSEQITGAIEQMRGLLLELLPAAESY